MSRRSTRRDFLKQTALAGAGFWVAGTAAPAKSRSANEKLNIALIGAGGRGRDNLAGVALTENIVALCDVDEARAAASFDAFPSAKKYHDFRKMLDEMHKHIDAVVVSTPDHTHAVASVMAMKMGKHCYTEKPLTHDVYEARVMRETAARHRVATQMGNLGISVDGFRRGVEVIRSGVIGPVHEVHVWTNRAGHRWPQGVPRPKERPPVPKTLSWDLWLGPAPERPYHRLYVPFSWRGWCDFGTGALGDMGCHTANLPFMGLKLGQPTSVVAETSGTNHESYPNWSIIHFEFPARGHLPAVKLTWYDGGKRPPAELGHGQKLADSGSLLVGRKGTFYSPSDYGIQFKLLPAKDFDGYEPPQPTLPRIHGGHYQEWLQAIRNGKPEMPMANFQYGSRLTEALLLGTVAMAVGRKIEWDSENMRVTNHPEANRYIRREYRKGWTL